MTIVRAAEALNRLGFDLALPTTIRVTLPPVFDDLCQIEVTPGPTVTATIDTKKMRWGYNSDEDVWRDDFTEPLNPAPRPRAKRSGGRLVFRERTQRLGHLRRDRKWVCAHRPRHRYRGHI